MSRHGKVCRDKQQYVATSTTSVATSSSMSRHRRPVSRQAAVCRDIDDQCRDKKALSRQETFVATRNAAEAKKKPIFDIFDQISSPFQPRTIYILVFLGKGATGKIGEPLSWGFSL